MQWYPKNGNIKDANIRNDGSKGDASAAASPHIHRSLARISSTATAASNSDAHDTPSSSRGGHRSCFVKVWVSAQHVDTHPSGENLKRTDDPTSPATDASITRDADITSDRASRERSTSKFAIDRPGHGDKLPSQG